MNGNTCPICKTKNIKVHYYGQDYYYSCPMCGNFFLDDSWDYDGQQYDIKKLQNYLFYHKGKKRPYIALSDVYTKLNKTGWVDIYNLTPEMVEAWYPKTFAEKINLSLLWLSQHSDYMGMSVKIAKEDMELVFFLTNSYREAKDDAQRVAQDWTTEVKFLLRYLHHNELLEYHASDDSITDLMKNMAYTTFHEPFRFTLSSKAYDAIYKYQTEYENNKKVFIAMSFNPAIHNIYNAIAIAIIQAECEVVSMKSRIHNKQIVPEMLRLIKESKILVMDISEPNFGAYYEAGYAQGLGKEVIFTCKSDVMKKDKFPCSDNNDKECDFLKKYSKPHFDIAQKQILVWEDEADLTKQLTEWIKFLMG